MLSGLVTSSSKRAAMRMGTRAPSPQLIGDLFPALRDSASSGRTLAHGTPSFTWRKGVPRASQGGNHGKHDQEGASGYPAARVFQKLPPR